MNSISLNNFLTALLDRISLNPQPLPPKEKTVSTSLWGAISAGTHYSAGQGGASPTAFMTAADNTAHPAGAPGFSTELKNQAAPADPALASRMIGSVNMGTPVTAHEATTSPMAPTAQALFGPNPWVTNPGGKGIAGSYNYNHYYFATPQTAAKVAKMLGGTVVAMDAITPYGTFKQNQPNQMVQMPDGKLINAGLIAAMYDHGYTQQRVDQMIAGEISGNLV